MSIILFLLYSLSTIQASFDCHFCMGRLVEISSTGPQKICAGCGMDAKKDSKACCKDIQLSLKSGDKHISPIICDFSPSLYALPTSATWIIYSDQKIDKRLGETYSFHAPPALPRYLTL